MSVALFFTARQLVVSAMPNVCAIPPIDFFLLFSQPQNIFFSVSNRQFSDLHHGLSFFSKKNKKKINKNAGETKG